MMPAPATTDRALSRRQALIWTGQQLDPDVPLYNMILAWTIDADLDVAAFRAAFRALIDGCDALRTVVVDEGGGPRHRTLAGLEYDVPVVDLRGEPDPEAAAAAWMEERGRRMFAPAERLFDAALLRTGPRRYVWYLNQHHVVSDAWSAGVLLRRHGELYRLAREGLLGDAPAMPSYAAALDAEEAALATAESGAAARYWQERLAEPLEPLTFYGPRPAVAGPETVRVEAAIGGERAARLAAFLARPGVATISPDLTALRVLQTVLFAVLHRVAGHDRLAIGTPFHNRTTAEARDTAGLFMNLYPVVVTVAPGETMASLLHQVGRELFEGMQRARFPLEAAAESGAFEVVLNYVNAPWEDFAGEPVTAEWRHCGYGDRAHALRLQALPQAAPGAFVLYFDVKAGLFDEDARRRLVDHFLRVLDQWLADPEVAIGDLQLVPLAELDRQVRHFNATGWAAPERSVVDAFRAQAAATPAAAAIRAGDAVMAYGELLDRVEGLARRLATAGIGPGSLVAIYVPRSADAVVAMLGTLMAGAAYVPIDPAAPPARIRHVLDDTGAARVLTSLELAAGLPEGAPVELMPAAPGDGPLPAGPGPADPAYVMYTSGSTGMPKGVRVTHGGLANYVAWAGAHYCGGEARDFALFTSLAFDLTVTSIFVPLTTGGAVVVYPEGDRPAVVEVFEDDRAEVVKLTPAHLAVVRDLGLRPARLRALIVGGEDFKQPLAADVDRAFGGRVAIYNEYGPTETVVGCMIHRFDPARDKGGSVPIGRPAAGAEIYLLDRYGQPVPPGVVGEILVGGPGVADGYLNRPELTAERFVTRPPLLAGAGQGRLYRTGDLGRWSPGPGGEPMLEFLGRADDQVKLHGYRIELGEIEAALAAHPAVSDAAAALMTGAVAAGGGVEHCARCGLPSTYPHVSFDGGVCSICRDYDTYRDQVDRYFGDRAELAGIARRIAEEGAGRPYDCLVLLSGGKDSTYMLYQVVALGLRPLAFTLDNGYISPEAIANCRRATDDLGVDLVVGATPHMDAIFADSLERFSNVCNGCFKTIYTLGVNLALQHGVRHIFTGLARGQLFETRLSDMYAQRIFDAGEIDRYVAAARRAYHAIDDAVSEHLDVAALRDGATLDRIEFVDYYRYDDVELAEVLAFLAERAPWVRPADTGRSTNCRINDVGIYVHTRERGFHNYAFPYAWDVRLGHKRREEALAELDDDIDEAYVEGVLDRLGYRPRPPAAERATAWLAGYYVAPAEVDAAELRAHLAATLPDYMIPARFVRLDALPLTRNGKVDRAALPRPGRDGRDRPPPPPLPPDQAEVAAELLAVWRQIFGLDDIGAGDNFFDLGGDSIIAIQIVARAAQHGLHLVPGQIFDHQTVAALAAVVDRRAATRVDAEQTVTGRSPATPAQAPFLDRGAAAGSGTEVARLAVPSGLRTELLREALAAVTAHHDALAARFVQSGDRWEQVFGEPAPRPEVVRSSPPAAEAALAGVAAGLDPAAGRLVGAVHAGDQVLLAVHRLAVDPISWHPLLADLDAAYGMLDAGRPVELPAKTASYRQWSEAVAAYAASEGIAASRAYWLTRPAGLGAALPAARGEAGEARARLDAAATQALLGQANDAYGTEPAELVLVALARAVTGWAGAQSVVVDVSAGARADLDLDVSRTVGRFTAVSPLVLTLPSTAGPGDDVVAVKQEARAVAPHRLAYGALRHLSPDAETRRELAGRPAAPVLFTYLGRLDRTASPGTTIRLVQPPRPLRGPEHRQEHPLAVTVHVIGDELQAHLTGGPAAAVAGSFEEQLRVVVEHCLEHDAGGRTPADFSLAGLSQAELDRLADLLDS